MSNRDKLWPLKQRVARLSDDDLKLRHGSLMERNRMDQREIDVIAREIKRREK